MNIKTPWVWLYCGHSWDAQAKPGDMLLAIALFPRPDLMRRDLDGSNRIVLAWRHWQLKWRVTVASDREEIAARGAGVPGRQHRAY